MGPPEYLKLNLIGCPHNPEGQSDDRLNNDMS